MAERRYHLWPVDEATSHNVKMKAIGFKKATGQHGIGSHFCFIAGPLLGLCIAARQFFCSCNGCKTKLSLDTIEERYSGPFDECKYLSLYKIDNDEGWNDVRILIFQPQVDCDVEESEETLVHTLLELCKTIPRGVVVGRIDAYAVNGIDWYYLVGWIEESHAVKVDEIVMVEDAPMMLFKGEWICEGKWWDKVSRAKFRHTVRDMVVTVCMKSVINADLITSPISEANTFPRVHSSVQDQVLSLHLQKLHARDHDFIIEEIGRRELLNANKDIDGE